MAQEPGREGRITEMTRSPRALNPRTGYFPEPPALLASRRLMTSHDTRVSLHCSITWSCPSRLAPFVFCSRYPNKLNDARLMSSLYIHLPAKTVGPLQSRFFVSDIGKVPFVVWHHSIIPAPGYPSLPQKRGSGCFLRQPCVKTPTCRVQFWASFCTYICPRIIA